MIGVRELSLCSVRVIWHVLLLRGSAICSLQSPLRRALLFLSSLISSVPPCHFRSASHYHHNLIPLP